MFGRGGGLRKHAGWGGGRTVEELLWLLSRLNDAGEPWGALASAPSIARYRRTEAGVRVTVAGTGRAGEGWEGVSCATADKGLERWRSIIVLQLTIYRTF